LHDHRLTTCCAIGPSAPLSDRLLIRFIGDVSLIPSSASAIGAFPVSATERFARSGPSTKTLSRSHVRAIEFCWARLVPASIQQPMRECVLRHRHRAICRWRPDSNLASLHS
jgi:hypothetical protein